MGILKFATDEHRWTQITTTPSIRVHLCSSVAAFVLFFLPGFIHGQDWPQFRGNHALTGVAPNPLPDTLKLIWTYDAAENEKDKMDASIESSAAIVNGVVYVGSMNGYLLAIDLATGKERWKYKAAQEIEESSPAVSNGIVYVGDLSGMFHAVDTATGKSKWTFKTGGEIKSSPVVFTDGGVEKVLIGSYDQSLYCLNAKTGAVLWKFSINGPVHATPSIANGVAYLTGCDEVFYGVRLSDGKEVQHVPSGAYTGASPALLLSPPSAMAFFGTFNNDVLGVNITTKRIIWRYEHPQRHFPFYASAAITPSLVIVGGRDKMVHALLPKPGTNKGKAAWTFLTKARVESSPAIAGTRIYVGSNDGTLYVLDLATGKKLWEFTAGAPISASPAIGGGRLVVGDQDGKLYCLGG
jgi:outer membrane protein assembly factor BamB